METIEKIVLGTAQFGLRYGISNIHGQPDEESVFELLEQSHRRGIQMLDTAEDYGTAQDVIGKYLQRRTPEFEVISKISSKVTDPQMVRSNLDTTLSQLHIDHLYAYLFHRFENYRRFPLLAKAIEDLRIEGKIKKTGVSIYSNEELAEVINIPNIEIIQLPLNLLDNVAQKKGLLERAKEAGKEIHVRSIYLQGLFFMTDEQIPAKLAPLMPSLKAIRNLAKENGVSVESLALNYVINNKMVDKVLFGVDTNEHLNRSLDSLECPLPSEVLEQVEELIIENRQLLNPRYW
jgi:aryl-alcohol dehydrogenase-like predicted oxidoreductase